MVAKFSTFLSFSLINRYRYVTKVYWRFIILDKSVFKSKYDRINGKFMWVFTILLRTVENFVISTTQNTIRVPFFFCQKHTLKVIFEVLLWP